MLLHAIVLVRFRSLSSSSILHVMIYFTSFMWWSIVRNVYTEESASIYMSYIFRVIRDLDHAWTHSLLRIFFLEKVGRSRKTQLRSHEFCLHKGAVESVCQYFETITQNFRNPAPTVLLTCFVQTFSTFAYLPQNTKHPQPPATKTYITLITRTYF